MWGTNSSPDQLSYKRNYCSVLSFQFYGLAAGGAGALVSLKGLQKCMDAWMDGQVQSDIRSAGSVTTFSSVAALFMLVYIWKTKIFSLSVRSLHITPHCQWEKLTVLTWNSSVWMTHLQVLEATGERQNISGNYKRADLQRRHSPELEISGRNTNWRHSSASITKHQCLWMCSVSISKALFPK